MPIEELIRQSFNLQGKEAIDHIEKVLRENKVDTSDNLVLTMFYNYLYHCIQLKLFKKGSLFADSIQLFAPNFPLIYHNTACVYCLNGLLDKAADQVRLAREHGGFDLIDKIIIDEDLRPLLKHPVFLEAISARRSSISGDSDKRLVDVVNKLLTQFQETAKSKCKLGPPATDEQIKNLEAVLSFNLPPSYRRFLKHSDGWVHFNVFENLFSCKELLTKKGKNIDFVLKWWEAGDYPAEKVKSSFVIGGGARRILYFDRRTTKENGEMDLVDFRSDEGENDRYADFLSFLEISSAEDPDIEEEE